MVRNEANIVIDHWEVLLIYKQLFFEKTPTKKSEYQAVLTAMTWHMCFGSQLDSCTWKEMYVTQL